MQLTNHTLDLTLFTDLDRSDEAHLARVYIPVDEALCKRLSALVRSDSSSRDATTRISLDLTNGVVLEAGEARLNDVESIQPEVSPDGGVRAVALGIARTDRDHCHLFSPETVDLDRVLDRARPLEAAG